LTVINTIIYLIICHEREKKKEAFGNLGIIFTTLAIPPSAFQVSYVGRGNATLG
jgi:hypothetical protein